MFNRIMTRYLFAVGLVGFCCRSALAAEASTGEVLSDKFFGIFDKIANYTVADYELWRLITSLFILFAALAVNTIIRQYMKNLSARSDKEEETESGQSKSFVGLVVTALQRPTRIVVWALAARFIGPVLIPEHATHAVWLCESLFSVSLAVFIYDFVEVIEYYLYIYAAKTETALDDMLVPMVRKSTRFLVVIVAGLHLYNSITGKPITTILAGLGIGGLAFALAAQDMLKNIFGFVTIVLDRPFTIGERITMDEHDGVVESVGFRSIRLRRLDGHLVTIPNSRASDSIVHNIARRPYIKRVMNITITYDTPLGKVQKAVEIVRELLKDHEGMHPDYPPRVYFSDLNADSLNILAIYWYHPPEYWDFLEFSQKINLELMRRYEEEGIEFAFPTQTLYLAGDPNRELIVNNRYDGQLPAAPSNTQ